MGSGPKLLDPERGCLEWNAPIPDKLGHTVRTTGNYSRSCLLGNARSFWFSKAFFPDAFPETFTGIMNLDVVVYMRRKKPL